MILLGEKETNRQFTKVAQAAFAELRGAFNLILDSRSETDTDFTRLLGANAEPSSLELC